MLVVSDAGPLHYLILLGHVELLNRLYGDVVIPSGVAAELTHPSAPEPVRAFVSFLPPWISVRSVNLKYPDLAILGQGEREAIELTLSLATQAQFLLCDDGQARKVAKNRGIRVLGTLGVLRDAALAGHLEIEEALHRLGTKTNFRGARSLYAQVIDEIRRALGTRPPTQP